MKADLGLNRINTAKPRVLRIYITDVTMLTTRNMMHSSQGQMADTVLQLHGIPY